MIELDPVLWLVGFFDLLWSEGAFLWDALDQDQQPEITRIMLQEMNRWIHSGQVFIGRGYLVQHDPSDLRSLILIQMIPKECTLSVLDLGSLIPIWIIPMEHTLIFPSKLEYWFKILNYTQSIGSTFSIWLKSMIDRC